MQASSYHRGFLFFFDTPVDSSTTVCWSLSRDTLSGYPTTPRRLLLGRGIGLVKLGTILALLRGTTRRKSDSAKRNRSSTNASHSTGTVTQTANLKTRAMMPSPPTTHCGDASSARKAHGVSRQAGCRCGISAVQPQSETAGPPFSVSRLDTHVEAQEQRKCEEANKRATCGCSIVRFGPQLRCRWITKPDQDPVVSN